MLSALMFDDFCPKVLCLFLGFPLTPPGAVKSVQACSHHLLITNMHTSAGHVYHPGT